MPPAGEDPFQDALLRWAAEARQAEAARQRSARRWQEQLAAEEMTFSGLLVDLMERQSHVRLTTSSGRHHGGVIVQAGLDFCALAAEGRSTVAISTRALTAVQVEGPSRKVGKAGRREPDSSAGSLGEMLAFLSADQPRIRYVLQGISDPYAGVLRAIGEDIITIETEAAPVQTIFVPLSQLTEVSLPL